MATKFLFNPLSGKFDLVTSGPPFVDDTIESTETLLIPDGKQLIVGGPYTVLGTLVIEGALWVL